MADEDESDAPLEEALERTLDEADGDGVAVDTVLRAFGDRALGPVLTLLGVAVIIPPVGVIPFAPMIAAVVIMLFAGQFLLGRRHVWAPRRIRELEVDKARLERAFARARPILRRLDGLVGERLVWATSGPARQAASLVVVALAAAMIPLEVIPFAVAPLGAAVAAIGVALFARDGLLMLIGFVLAVGSFVLATTILT